MATAASEGLSINESIANPEDSILTTTSTTSKKAKGRKAATTKGRKTKAKKEEPVEDVEALNEEELPAAKPSRGKKRDSSAIGDMSVAISEAPAPKKRATRTRASTAVDDSKLHGEEDAEMVDAPAPKKGGRKKTKAPAKSTRKASAASITSAASIASPRATPEAFPDDDEIERQLEADLENQLSEDEEITVDSDSERFKAKKNGVKRPEAKQEPAHEASNWAMFDPEPAEIDDDEIEDEFKALQAEMEVDEPEPTPAYEPELQPELQPELEPEPRSEPEAQELHIPKKGKKAGTRKASKQTKPNKSRNTPEAVEEEFEAEVPQEVAEEVAAPYVRPEMEESLQHEDSLASSGTVVTKTATARTSTGERGRGRPPKASLASESISETVELVEPPNKATTEMSVEPPAKRGRGRPPKISLASRASMGVEDSKPSEAPKRPRGRPSKKSLEAQKSLEVETREEPADGNVKVYSSEENQGPVAAFEEAQHSAVAPAIPASPSRSNHLANPPSTPGRIISPAPSARQAAISPSQSPQSSDAENQPPSSRPAGSATRKRVALAPVAATPTRGSPSKRNMIAGLRSTTPWTELDIDAVLGSPRKVDKENGVQRLLKRGQTLTSPERQMTVEEWIHHNAAEAETRLKHECEAIVSRFESEGSKAMRVLEGLVVE